MCWSRIYTIEIFLQKYFGLIVFMWQVQLMIRNVTNGIKKITMFEEEDSLEELGWKVQEIQNNWLI